MQSKNALESYAYNLRNAISDEEFAGKFDPADKAKLESSINDAISWLDSSQEASKEEYDDKQKELEAVANPIMQKLYGAAGAARDQVASLVLAVSLAAVLRPVASPVVLARMVLQSRRLTKGLVDSSRLDHGSMTCIS
ncbi:hypothetical protein PISMIDRAFT_10930 [Pisolithus microcarpus 441]|uniref:Uncharacterized protein n=1 Tax=Pisolithus microcarpus 441 TaxID=765257 RepID=A0A0C9ZM71_9AGAM|nr:hypothetical protein PISMIDRAFT_10930 [Pisolithus microcarpus 441]